jgi:hypothetical protein
MDFLLSMLKQQAAPAPHGTPLFLSFVWYAVWLQHVHSFGMHPSPHSLLPSPQFWAKLPADVNATNSITLKRAIKLFITSSSFAEFRADEHQGGAAYCTLRFSP